MITCIILVFLATVANAAYTLQDYCRYALDMETRALDIPQADFSYRHHRNVVENMAKYTLLQKFFKRGPDSVPLIAVLEEELQRLYNKLLKSTVTAENRKRIEERIEVLIRQIYCLVVESKQSEDTKFIKKLYDRTIAGTKASPKWISKATTEWMNRAAYESVLPLYRIHKHILEVESVVESFKGEHELNTTIRAQDDFTSFILLAKDIAKKYKEINILWEWAEDWQHKKRNGEFISRCDDLKQDFREKIDGYNIHYIPHLIPAATNETQCHARADTDWTIGTILYRRTPKARLELGRGYKEPKPFSEITGMKKKYPELPAASGGPASDN